MPDLGALEEFLAGARVDPAVRALRPDYRAPLVTVDKLVPGPSDDVGEALLRRVETGLPRVKRLTDLYNAVSVLHQVPLRKASTTRG
jgi:DNA/RNA-binding domain of Phe-tRNA-synthetase-like protein